MLPCSNIFLTFLELHHLGVVHGSEMAMETDSPPAQDDGEEIGGQEHEPMETDPLALALDLKTALLPPLWKWQEGTQDPLTCVKLEPVGDRIINSKTIVLKGEEISYFVRGKPVVNDLLPTVFHTVDQLTNSIAAFDRGSICKGCCIPALLLLNSCPKNAVRKTSGWRSKSCEMVCFNDSGICSACKVVEKSLKQMAKRSSPSGTKWSTNSSLTRRDIRNKNRQLVRSLTKQRVFYALALELRFIFIYIFVYVFSGVEGEGRSAQEQHQAEGGDHFEGKDGSTESHGKIFFFNTNIMK